MRNEGLSEHLASLRRTIAQAGTFSVGGITFALISVAPVNANHVTFAFQLDRFECTGQCSGVDEFGDGVLAPWRTFGFGTAAEAAGVVTLSDPGVVTDVDGIPGERSDIFSDSSSFLASDGNGDFAGTSTWVSGLPPLNQSFNMLTIT